MSLINVQRPNFSPGHRAAFPGVWTWITLNTTHSKAIALSQTCFPVPSLNPRPPRVQNHQLVFQPLPLAFSSLPSLSSQGIHSNILPRSPQDHQKILNKKAPRTGRDESWWLNVMRLVGRLGASRLPLTIWKHGSWKQQMPVGRWKRTQRRFSFISCSSVLWDFWKLFALEIFSFKIHFKNTS